MQQPPILNASIVAAFVFSHSGEFGAVSLDVRIPGQGPNLDLIRSYRSSLADSIGALGRGWSCNLARRVEQDGKDVLYRDSTGSVHRFLHKRGGQYTSPPDLYAVLRESGQELVLEQRFGARTTFQAPEQGGQILAVTDSNGNELKFSYTANDVQIVNAVNRKILVTVEDVLWRRVTDQAGRTWHFLYDAKRLLVEAVRPATRDFPTGTSVTYGYDAHHRLVTLTDAKGQTYLVNHYDKLGRIVRQTHGAGEYALEYGDDRRTRCRLKNGGLLELDHDEAGHVTRSRLHARASAFSQEDLTDPHMDVALVTESEYNKAGELISRRMPSGRKMSWTYAEGDGDPRNRGNLVEVTHLPRPGTASGFGRITRTFEYAKTFQAVAAAVDQRGRRTTFEYDGRGNLVTTTYPAVTIQPVGEKRAQAAGVERVQRVRFAYDEHGRLVRRAEVDGSVTAFSYHEGLLARVVRDTDGVALGNEYRYDELGNCTETFDGKGNATRLVYNAVGRVETCFSRAPFEYRVDYTYDANYDEIENVQSFEHLAADRVTGKTDARTSMLREQRSYDELGNVVERRIAGGEKVIRETFIRDAGGRLVRQIQPLGNVTEYVYDERDLVIEKRFSVGGPQGFTERLTYTLDGSPRSRSDGDGNTTVHRYDGFERYQGFTDPSGTMKHQSLDEAGNVVAVTVSDAKRVLMEAQYQVDELNRVFRIDRAWRDVETGEPSGKSEWDGTNGVVSTVIEYGDNGRPSRVWNENHNIAAYAYDGCTRLTAVTDSTGQELSLAYDENGNVTELTASGPGGSRRKVLRRSFDAMDRIELQQMDGGAPERFRYNALGAIVEYIGRSGLAVYHTHDALGRHTGHAYALHGAARETISRLAARGGAPEHDVLAHGRALPGQEQLIARQFDYDDNYRLAAYVDAAGSRTVYKYDELDRQTSIVYPDGSVARVVYDARSNAVRVVNANGRETTSGYDATGRLVETVDSSGQSRRYTYDGAGRLLAARGRETLRRTYDSLSNVKTADQGLGTVRFEHDSAGNLIGLVYPSGREVRRTYDTRRRVTSVRDGDGTPIASFEYNDTDRVKKVHYGDALVATLEYDAQQRLELIEYRTTGDGKLVEGYRYAYDARDMMTHEIHVAAGEAFGERYFFDEARRPVRAQYGVTDVFDPASPFEQETTYDYLPEGKWSRRVDRDGSGRVLAESVGMVNSRNRYLRFGKYTLSYDRNGNCIRKESANPGFCLYTYDDANRLIKVECYDVNAHLVQTIEYFYDALGRQIRKVVTDAAGRSTEYTYVWIGSLLAEDYENGKLARSYVYGIGATPVQLSSQRAGGDFTYLLNGRGLVSGIVRNEDPNVFAEKYGYELTGNVFMTEVDGLPVDIPSRPTTFSGLDNPLVTGGVFGSVMSDWPNGTLSFPGGVQLDKTLSDALNALGDVGGKGHQSVTTTLANQLNSMISMLGLGGSAPAPSGSASDPGFTMNNPDWKWYADGDGGVSGGAGPKDSRVQWLQDAAGSAKRWADTPVNVGGVESSYGSLLGGVLGGVRPGDPAKATSPAGEGNPAQQAASNAATDAQRNNPTSGEPGQTSKDKANDAVNQAASAAQDKAKESEAIQNATKDPNPGTGTAYTDPDADASLGVVMPTPDELETRFNRLKHPANPNGGPMDDPVDTSSPLPQKGYVDPTQILVDPDAASTSGATGGINKLDIAPIDKVRDWQPEPGTIPSTSGDGDGGDTIGGHYP